MRLNRVICSLVLIAAMLSVPIPVHTNDGDCPGPGSWTLMDTGCVGSCYWFFKYREDRYAGYDAMGMFHSWVTCNRGCACFVW
jgi:hypothetical protein